MSNCKKTDKFFNQIEKAGLDRAFAKMTNIASDTLDCFLEDIIDDFVAEQERPRARIRYDEHYKIGDKTYEAYAVEIDPDRSGKWGLDCAYPFHNDGQLIGWRIVTKIRDLMKLGYDISFC